MEKEEITKIASYLVILGFILTASYTIWFTSFVPENISPKLMAQALLEVLLIFVVLGIIALVKKKVI